MNHPQTVEIVRFRLVPGTDEHAFLTANAALQTELQRMPGYLSRELLKGAGGQWIDIVHWDSMDNAHHAAEAIMKLDAALNLFQYLDQSSVDLVHVEQVAVFT